MTQVDPHGMREESGEYRGGKIGGYARVHVRYTKNDSECEVLIALDEHTWNEQLRTGEFPEWFDGAIRGCHFALQAASVEIGRCEIRRIVGLACDTTRRFVAIAAARAVWKICGFNEPDAFLDHLQEYLDSSSRCPGK